MRKVNEREELLWRIAVLFVSGIIFLFWRYLVFVLSVVNFFVVLITGGRNFELADFCGIFNSEFYRFLRYMTFETNERPFPFSDMKRIKKSEK